MIDFKKMMLENQLRNDITALCDYHGRCTNCYRFFTAEDKMNCSRCKDYYTDCICPRLTPKEIVEGEGDC